MRETRAELERIRNKNLRHCIAYSLVLGVVMGLAGGAAIRAIFVENSLSAWVAVGSLSLFARLLHGMAHDCQRLNVDILTLLYDREDDEDDGEDDEPEDSPAPQSPAYQWN